jgi:hypothetical protein
MGWMKQVTTTIVIAVAFLASSRGASAQSSKRSASSVDNDALLVVISGIPVRIAMVAMAR